MRHRRAGLIATTAVVAALLPSIADAPDLAAAPATAGVVRIAHDAVQIPVHVRYETLQVPVIVESVDRPSPTRSAALRQAPRRPAVRQEGVFARARRLFFGDGASRPEPFPRPQ